MGYSSWSAIITLAHQEFRSRHMFSHFPSFGLTLLFVGGALAGEPDLREYSSLQLLIAGKGELIYEDDFDREEVDDTIEDLGRPGWVTNSKNQANGVKQADLREGYLNITRAPDSKHGTSVRHDNPFDDGVVMAKFRLHDERGLGFHFNDPNCKVSSAGHICRVGVAPGKLDFRDGKMGQFNWEIIRKKKAGASKEELKELMQGKRVFFDASIEIGTWHQIAFLIRGDKAVAWIDEKYVGEFVSPGVDHPVKFNLALSVWGEAADVDDLRIWSLRN
ncbi:MAG: hypothetical protein SynsKO_21430 [Synoicihabitans sp.]